MNIELYLTEVIQFFIAFILLTSAWNKSLFFQGFTKDLSTNFNLPSKFSNMIAVIIITIEWLLAGIFFTDISNAYLAMQISLFLFSSFTIIAIFLLLKHEAISCNCFGNESRPISILDIVRNLMIITAIIYYVLMSSPNISVTLESKALLAIMGLIVTIIAINFHDIISILLFRGKV